MAEGRRGELAFLKVARAFPKTYDDALEQIDKVYAGLVATAPAARSPKPRLQAAEEHTLRWLFNGTNGKDTASAERIRCNPRTWTVLSCIFYRVPFFNLAVILQQKKFSVTLQKTLEDLMRILEAADTPKERTRQAQRCVAAVFRAVGSLMDLLREARTVQKAGRKASKYGVSFTFDRSGPSHIQGLFYKQTSEAIQYLEPMLNLAHMLLSGQWGQLDIDDNADEIISEPGLEGHVSWIDTFVAVWNLRKTDPGDSLQVAESLAPVALSMLGRLLDLPSNTLAKPTMDEKAGSRWAAALRLFLVKSVVQPAREEYLVSKATLTLSMAIGDEITVNASRALVVFQLALDIAHKTVGTTTKENEAWIQTVFEKIQSPVRGSSSLNRTEQNHILADMLDMAAKRHASPSRETLVRICQQSALPDTKKKGLKTTTDWRLVLAITRCDPETFLDSDKGRTLLDDIFEQLQASPKADSKKTDYQTASMFLISLAEGTIQYRSLPEFITRWYRSIRRLQDVQDLGPLQSSLLNKGIRTTVSKALESSLAIEELLALLNRLDTMDMSLESENEPDARAMARLVVFDSIAMGLSQDEYGEAIKTRLVDGFEDASLPKTLSPEILSILWRLIGCAMYWADDATVERTWNANKAGLKKLAKPKGGTPLSANSFEAFKLTFLLHMLLPLGAAKQEALDMVRRFFNYFKKELAVIDKDDKRKLVQKVAQQLEAISKADENVATGFGSNIETLATVISWLLSGPQILICGGQEDCESPSKFLSGSLLERSEKGAIIHPAVFHYLTGKMNALGMGEVSGVQTIVSTNQKSTTQRLLEGTMENYVNSLGQAHDEEDQVFDEVAQAILLAKPVLLAPPRVARILSILLPQGQETSLPPSKASSTFKLLSFLTQSPNHGSLDIQAVVHLGQFLQSYADSLPRSSAIHLWDRFHNVAAAGLKSYLTDSPSTKFGSAYDSISSWDSEGAAASPPVNVQMVILSALLVAVNNTHSSKIDATKISHARTTLAGVVLSQVEGYLQGNIDEDESMTEDGGSTETASLPLSLVLAFRSSLVPGAPVLFEQPKLTALTPNMKSVANELCGQGEKMGWMWKTFMARYLQGADRLPHETHFQGLCPRDHDSIDVTGQADLSLPPVFDDAQLIDNYVQAEVANYTYGDLLAYTKDLAVALRTKPEWPMSQIFAIRLLLARIFDIPNALQTEPADGEFSLGAVHGELTRRLAIADGVVECSLLSDTVATLLANNKSAKAMNQWNVEITLEAVAHMVELNSPLDNDAVRASSTTFDEACELMTAILQRHRFRVEDRYNLVVPALQQLLQRLIVSSRAAEVAAGSDDDDSNDSNSQHATGLWVPQAARLSRVFEMICEPKAAMVSVKHKENGAGAGEQNAQVWSAVDKSKRLAGKYMYMVLLSYVHVQTPVPMSISRALEPGLFAILNVMSDNTRNMANDSMDAQGQALFKDLLHNWQQNGRWKGI